jgi:hypothetical protein
MGKLFQDDAAILPENLTHGSANPLKTDGFTVVSGLAGGSWFKAPELRGLKLSTNLNRDVP